MNRKNKIAFILLIFIVTLCSCNEVWDLHYKKYDTFKIDLTISEYIKSNENMSIFSKMLSISGYDSILNQPQTFTVWVPVDSALIDVDLQDTMLVKNIVKNHITRSLHSVAGLSSEVVYLVNGKFTTFKKTGDDYLYGTVILNKFRSDIGTANGIVHELKGALPFKPNLWEFINSTPGLDSLKQFMNTKSVYEFDEKNSIEIGTNKYGQSVYDSVKIFSNSILDQIGALNNDDSIYSAILPSNKAWTTAYNLIKSRYKIYGDNSSNLQRQNAMMALVSNLIFDTTFVDTQSLQMLKSTAGQKFSNPGYLFDTSVKTELSNGFAYVTDSLRFKPTDTYQKKIVVEAENASYSRSAESANLALRSSLGTAYSDSVSEKQYLYIDPTSTTYSSTKINFPIPNTLSGKYNVYCVFVPTSITVSGSTKANKVKFYLSYLDANGAQQSDAAVLSDHTLNTTKGATGAIFSTNVGKMTKMFVTQITFPYCNLYKTGDATSSITTSLKVQNGMVASETLKFDKVLRIDCIILEPAD